jgi:hypothetical protein
MAEGRAADSSQRPVASGNRASAGRSEQAQGALRDTTDRAAELWDEAYEQGERFYRQGSQALAHVDSNTVAGWLLAGGIGFALAWLIFGQSSWGTDEVARRMSESSERLPPRNRRR